MKKPEKTWGQFFNELKDGRRMSVNDYKLIKKTLNYPSCYTIEHNREESNMQRLQKRIREMITQKQVKLILKRNPELLELFI